MVEITDQKSAFLWLEKQDHQTCVWLAARCALRVVPAIGFLGEEAINELAFLALRASLILMAASSRPSDRLDEFSLATNATNNAVQTAYLATLIPLSNKNMDTVQTLRYTILDAVNTVNSSPTVLVPPDFLRGPNIDSSSAAGNTASVVALAAIIVDSSFSSSTASNTSSSDSDFAAATFHAVSKDTGAPLKWSSLWPSGGLPVDLEQGWGNLKNYWIVDSEVWSFWIEWYEGILAGDPMPPELILKIALAITDAQWDAGPEVVAERIKEIETQFLSDRTSLAEKLTLDPATGLFRVDAIEIQNVPLVSALLSRVRDALEDAVQGNNGLNATSREVRVLSRTLSQYAHDPQRIEMDFTSIAGGLRRQLHETHELPQSEDNHALLEAVEDGVRGIRANHPDVAANRVQLAQQHMREMSDEDRALLEQAQPVLEAISHEPLREDFSVDIPKLINDALLPLPNGAPALPGVDESIRVFGRASRMAILYNEATAKGAKIFDSDTTKSIRLIGVVGGVGRLLWALVQLGIRLFGVIV